MSDINGGSKVLDKVKTYDDRRNRIGSRIKMLRNKAGWTQTRLGNELGELLYGDKVKQSMISSWEKGDTLPTLKNLLALSQLFNCDIGYLLCDYDDLRKDTSNLCEVTGLSSETIERLSSFAQADKKRFEECGEDIGPGSYYEEAKRYLFMPTFNLIVGHPEFGPFMAMLVDFLIDRNAPPNAGGPVDPREYAQGRRTIGAQEYSEYCLCRAIQTLRNIMKDIAVGNRFDAENDKWRKFFSTKKNNRWDVYAENEEGENSQNE